MDYFNMTETPSPSTISRFLDEPTSGLDTFTAFTVCEILKTLAKGGRTIVATIHQPSSELFFLFDDICLLSEGRVVYFGPVVDIVAYFARMDYKCPQYSNPAGIGNVCEYVLLLYIRSCNCNGHHATCTLYRHISDFLFMSVLNANKENNNANTAEKEKERLKLLASHWEASEEFKLVREQATDSKVKGGLSKTSYKYLSSNWNQFSFLIGRAW